MGPRRRVSSKRDMEGGEGLSGRLTFRQAAVEAGRQAAAPVRCLVAEPSHLGYQFTGLSARLNFRKIFRKFEVGPLPLPLTNPSTSNSLAAAGVVGPLCYGAD